jgi:hypothetical protein
MRAHTCTHTYLRRGDTHGQRGGGGVEGAGQRVCPCRQGGEQQRVDGVRIGGADHMDGHEAALKDAHRTCSDRCCPCPCRRRITCLYQGQQQREQRRHHRRDMLVRHARRHLWSRHVSTAVEGDLRLGAPYRRDRARRRARAPGRRCAGAPAALETARATGPASLCTQSWPPRTPAPTAVSPADRPCPSRGRGVGGGGKRTTTARMRGDGSGRPWATSARTGALCWGGVGRSPSSAR